MTSTTTQPKEPIMSLSLVKTIVQVSTQQVNCGPVRSVTTSLPTANKIMNEAMNNDAQFAEIYDLDLDAQLRFHLAPMRWV